MTKPKLPTAYMRVSLALLLTLAAISAGVLGLGGKSALAAPLGAVPAPSVMVPGGGAAYLDIRGFALQPGGSIAAEALRPGIEPLGPAQLRTTLHYGINWGYADSEPQQVALALWWAQGGAWLDANHATAERIASAAASSQGTPSWLADGRSLLQLLASGEVTVADLTLTQSAMSAAMGSGTLAVHNTGTQDVLVHLPYGTTFTGASGPVLVWATGAGTVPPAATSVATVEPVNNTPAAAATDTPAPATPTTGNSKGDFTPAPRVTAPAGKSSKASPTTAASATPIPTDTPLPTETPLPQPTDTPAPEPTAIVAQPTAVKEPPANSVPDGGSKKNTQPPASDSNTAPAPPANAQEPAGDKEASGSAAPAQEASEREVAGQGPSKDVAMGPLPVTPAATPTRPRPTQPAAPAPNGTSVSSDQIPPPNGTSVSGQVPPPVTTAVGGPGAPVVPQPQQTAFLPVPTTEPTSAPETKPTEQPTAGAGSDSAPGVEEIATSPPVVETKEPQATPVPAPPSGGSDEAAGGAPDAPPVINVEPQDTVKAPEPAPASQLPGASNQGSPPNSTPATGGGQTPLAWWLSFSSLILVLGGWALRRAGSTRSLPTANAED